MNSGKVDTRQATPDGHAGTAEHHAAAAPTPGDEAVHDLVADVQDLLSQLAHVADPDIARLRVRVRDTLAAVRQSVARSGAAVRSGTRDVVRGSDRYVRHNPWQAVGLAAAAGAIVALLASRRG
jgi:ElaB/YqjD/DUF883 family membrane-anchored ribosome-binding protein